MTRKCENCDNRTKAWGGYCQSCKSTLFHARKRIAKEGLLVEQAGGAWWIWDAKGEVLVIGRETRGKAVIALAFGDGLDP